MKNIRIIRTVTTVFVLISVLFSVTYTLCDEDSSKTDVFNWFFEDVSPSDWYYNAIKELNADNVIPYSEKFRGEDVATRSDLAFYLYNMCPDGKREISAFENSPFADVAKKHPFYDALCWAYEKGLILPDENGNISPDMSFSKEELCRVAVKYLDALEIKVSKKGTDEPFSDSLLVSESARSFVVSAKLLGIIKGDSNNNLHPQRTVTRGELSVLLSSLNKAQKSPADSDEEVEIGFGAYDHLYVDYEDGTYGKKSPYVKKGPKADLSYFDDAVFVGDSVSMSLQFYCASTGALGKAKFLCAGSFSPTNAHAPITEKSVHPLYNGVKVRAEDGVKLYGAKKVYIMLGINSLEPFDLCVSNMKLLIDKILWKSPDAKIIIQSVTPMTATSPIERSTLNNEVIRRYNRELYKMAKENGWYYINVSEALCDINGNLKDEYCSDPKTMGIHFNYTADKEWVDYLLTHTPDIQ